MEYQGERLDWPGIGMVLVIIALAVSVYFLAVRVEKLESKISTKSEYQR